MTYTYKQDPDAYTHRYSFKQPYSYHTGNFKGSPELEDFRRHMMGIGAGSFLARTPDAYKMTKLLKNEGVKGLVDSGKESFKAIDKTIGRPKAFFSSLPKTHQLKVLKNKKTLDIIKNLKMLDTFKGAAKVGFKGLPLLGVAYDTYSGWDNADSSKQDYAASVDSMARNIAKGSKLGVVDSLADYIGWSPSRYTNAQKNIWTDKNRSLSNKLLGSMTHSMGTVFAPGTKAFNYLGGWGRNSWDDFVGSKGSTAGDALKSIFSGFDRFTDINGVNKTASAKNVSEQHLLANNIKTYINFKHNIRNNK